MDTIPSNVKLPEQTKLFINNEYVESLDGDTFEVIQPATEKVICRVSSAKAGDVDRAVAAAKKAFNAEWKTMGPMGRQKAIIKLAGLVETHAEDLAILESYNNGQPIALARGLVNSYADQIRFFAGWCGKIDGRVPFISPNHHAYTIRQPIGVCGLILPWNVPLWTLMVKLIPCLAMGNTAVIKPAEQTPLTTLRFAELCKEAGIPAGVVNIVPGFGYSAGSAISQHMEISKVAFTGSTDVGRLVMKAAAESNLKKVQLELGGKSPLVIMPDADVDRAAQIAILALFTNNGQLCTAGSRTFVHESIYDRFVATAVELAKGIKVGDQLNPEFNQGPQVDLKQFKKILEYIEIGKTEAKLVHGGNRHGSTGFFIQPTIFADVTNNMRIAREEIFGPVMSIIKYTSDENLIEMCNDSPYGLAAGLVTNDISNVFEFANNIAAGTVWVNTYHEVLPQCEFGGCKQSGFGKEMGREGIDEWSQTKSVIISTTKVVNSKSKI